MMEDTGEDVLRQKPSIVATFFKRVGQTYQIWLDRWTPHTMSRWVFTVVLVMLFILRIVMKQGWYIVTYGLAIYHLNLLLAFLTPKIDPALAHLEEEDSGDGLELPTRQNDEFHPFNRGLPEFKSWNLATKSAVLRLLTHFRICIRFW